MAGLARGTAGAVIELAAGAAEVRCARAPRHDPTLAPRPQRLAARLQRSGREPVDAAGVQLWLNGDGWLGVAPRALRTFADVSDLPPHFVDPVERSALLGALRTSKARELDSHEQLLLAAADPEASVDLVAARLHAAWHDTDQLLDVLAVIE